MLCAKGDCIGINATAVAARIANAVAQTAPRADFADDFAMIIWRMYILPRSFCVTSHQHRHYRHRPEAVQPTYSRWARLPRTAIVMSASPCLTHVHQTCWEGGELSRRGRACQACRS